MKRISQRRTLWFSSLCLFSLMVVHACTSSEQKPASSNQAPSTQEKTIEPVSATRNLPPVMQSVSISPPSPTVQEMLKAQPSAKDVNQDQISFYYQWYVNGNEISGEVQSDLSPGSFIKGDRVTCLVTPFDGLSQGKPMMSAETMITNSPPKIIKVDFAPAHPGKNTGVELLVTAEDPDQDALTYRYQWFVDGKPLKDANSSKLEGTFLKKETYVWASVTLDDGTLQDQAFSLKIPISNSSPVISSTPPTRPPGGMVYTYKVEAGDPDGDALTFSASGAEGVSINTDGVLSWQPKQSQAGLNRLQVIAKDKDGATATQEWEVMVSFETPKTSANP